MYHRPIAFGLGTSKIKEVQDIFSNLLFSNYNKNNTYSTNTDNYFNVFVALTYLLKKSFTPYSALCRGLIERTRLYSYKITVTSGPGLKRLGL